MKFVKVSNPGGAALDPYRDLVRIHTTPAYDFVVSLRAMFNPRRFAATRTWSSAAREFLTSEQEAAGRFLFQGLDTALGYGVMRLIPGMLDEADPARLIDVVRATDARDLALLMLDSGETDAGQLAAYRRFVADDADSRGLDRVLADLDPGWARRCRRILGDPDLVKSELIDLLEGHLAGGFRAEVARVSEALNEAASVARSVLVGATTRDAIEQLTGGYTLAEDLDLTAITIAPSTFAHPYMSTRIDDQTGEALVIYGVRTDLFAGQQPVRIQQGLIEGLKALADGNRLAILRLISERPLYGTELTAALRLSQPTVHHHLAQLRAAGLIRQERQKGGMRYTIRRRTTDAIIRDLAELVAVHDAANALSAPIRGANTR